MYYTTYGSDTIHSTSKGHGLPMVANCKNRTKLQAVLQMKIDDYPKDISFSGKADSDVVFEVTVSISVRWSINPSLPVTICTDGTPIGSKALYSHFSMQSCKDPRSRLLVNPYPGGENTRRRPQGGDWRAQGLNFVTIPSQSSGDCFRAKIPFTREALLERENTSHSYLGCPTIFIDPPARGTKFELKLSTPPGRSGYYDWWNFGDLDEDLSDQEFTKPESLACGSPTQVTPTSTWPWPSQSYRYFPKPGLMSWDCWEDLKDDKANDMIFLEVELDQTSFKFKVVDKDFTGYNRLITRTKSITSASIKTPDEMTLLLPRPVTSKISLRMESCYSRAFHICFMLIILTGLMILTSLAAFGLIKIDDWPKP